MLFNIYYINFSKIYEIKMMLSNLITTGGEIQNTIDKEQSQEIKAKLGAQFLNLFSSNIEADKKTIGSDSQKILEKFEIKMTKSHVLNEVIKKSKAINTFNDNIKEGTLIKIDNVSLSLENEKELRMVKMFSNGSFKGMEIPGISGLDINNIFNSIFKDYAYKLKGKINNNEDEILIKIPITFESEFENLYSVDDLFIGKVTLIGIYKGKIKIDELKNSFQFFQELSNNENIKKNEEIQESQYQKTVDKIDFISSGDDKNYHYIDILSIVQNIEPNEDKINE